MKYLFAISLLAVTLLCSPPPSHAAGTLNILGIEIGCQKNAAIQKMSQGRSNQNVRIVKQRIENNFNDPELVEFGLEAFSREKGPDYSESSRFRALLAPSGEVIGLSRTLHFNDREELPTLTSVRRMLTRKYGTPSVIHWDKAGKQMIYAWIRNSAPADIDKNCIACELEKSCKRGCWSDISSLTENGCGANRFDEFLLVKASPAANAHRISRIDYTLASTERINATIAHFNGILNKEMTATNEN